MLRYYILLLLSGGNLVYASERARPAQIYSLRNDQHSSLFFAHSLIHRRNFSSVLYSIRFQKALPAYYHPMPHARAPLFLSLHENRMYAMLAICAAVNLSLSLSNKFTYSIFVFILFLVAANTVKLKFISNGKEWASKSNAWCIYIWIVYAYFPSFPALGYRFAALVNWHRALSMLELAT